jgi:hypothetical protein
MKKTIVAFVAVSAALVALRSINRSISEPRMPPYYV